MNIKEILEQARLKLKQNNIEDEAIICKQLLSYVLNKNKQYLIINMDKEVPKEQYHTFNKYINKIIDGYPLQYITHNQEFMGINFYVDENVLIPQPDTEILVEKTIEIAKTIEKPIILDMCTGSGAIAISIKKNVNEAQVIATDISKEALEVAKQNDKKCEITFIQSDLFENINNEFDIIVSNPPYVKKEEIKKLSKEVQNEPKLALDGGDDGLYFYRKIIGQAYKYLKTNGYLCLEIGEDQKKEVCNLIIENGKYAIPIAYKDLENNDRVIITKKVKNS